MRIARFLTTIIKQRDYSSAFLFAAIALIASWLCCLPFFGSVQRTALNRFHLQTKPFLVWSVQQTVPSIYNFKNEFDFETDAENPSAKLQAFAAAKTVNHFPMRVVTFADCRFVFFHEGEGGNLTVRSRFQDQELVTYWRIDNTPGKGLRLSQRMPK